MPSTHDQPPNSSSQLLVSRHDASLRPSDHGLAEGLSDEADEPPNIHSCGGSGSSANQPQQTTVTETDDQADSSGTEGDEDRSDHEEEEVGRVTKLVSPVAGKLRSRSSPTAATAALRLRDASVDTTDSSSGDEAASDSGSISPSPSTSASPPPTLVHTLTPPMHLPALTAFNTAATGYSLPANYDPSLPTDVVPEAGVSVSWVNPKLEARTSHTGSGIFALQAIEKDEVMIVWTGRILSAEQTLTLMDTADKHYILQIADGFYQTPLQAGREPADWTNHSCAPNAGFGKASPICLSAMRAIGVGEEVTFDYGMCETDERLWEPMECMCGAEQCRGFITANDWRLHPVLWERYKGYFSPHVQKCIDAYRAQLEQPHATSTVGAAAAVQALNASADVSRVKSVNQSCVVVGSGWLDRMLYALGVVRVGALQQAGVAITV